MVEIRNMEDQQLSATIAIHNRLFVPGWSLYGILKSIQNGSDCCKIVFALSEGKAIGVAVLESTNSPMQLYVKKSFRRLGIGTSLVNAIKKDFDNVKAAQGMKGSFSFYNHVGIPVIY